ncbi:MAG: hypothetical protein J3K34DRAFT_517850 [Monoraphidium minutum]|nr:MAG: hypothetical protein J3K34DRAFT_517850 [Monoraphidium minutum]
MPVSWASAEEPGHGMAHAGLPEEAEKQGQGMGTLAEQSETLKRALGCVMLLLLGAACYLAMHALRLLWPARYAIAAVVAAGEVVFFVLWCKRYTALNTQPDVHAPKHCDSMRLFERFVSLCYSLPDGVDLETYLCAWFRGARVDEINRGNMEELMAYGFWYKSRQEMAAAGRGHVPAEMVDQLEKAFDHTFPPGYNERLSFMSHLWEPLRAEYRPLLFYIGMEVVAVCTRQIMASYGFKRHELGCLTYYTYKVKPVVSVAPATALAMHHAARRAGSGTTGGGGTGGGGSAGGKPGSAEWTPFAVQDLNNPLNAAVPLSKDMPIVFCHGVGGLSLYLEMIKYILDLGHPVICLEYKHVSLRLTQRIPTIDDVIKDLVHILDKLDIGRACIVGHSYGTFVGSRLVQQHRDRVHTLCLIDPVCFGMFMPHLLHNFIYRRPRLNVWQPDVLLRDLMLYFASRDLHLSATFARRFYWSDMNLWPEDMPPGSVVLLSGNDDLVHADEVKLMLEQSGSHIKVMYNPHLWHGAFLLDPEVKKGLTSEIQGMLARTGSFAYRLTKPVVQKTVHVVQSALSTVGSLAAEPSGLLAALSGSVLGGSFTAGGAARRRAARATADGALGGGGPGGGGSGGGAGGGGPGGPAARASADGGVAAQLGGGGGAAAGDAVLRATVSAQTSLDRAMMLCSAVLEEKLDATAQALAGPSSMGSPRLPPMSSCRETLVQRRKPKPGGDDGGGGGGNQ